MPPATLTMAAGRQIAPVCMWQESAWARAGRRAHHAAQQAPIPSPSNRDLPATAWAAPIASARGSRPDNGPLAVPAPPLRFGNSGHHAGRNGAPAGAAGAPAVPRLAAPLPRRGRATQQDGQPRPAAGNTHHAAGTRPAAAGAVPPPLRPLPAARCSSLLWTGHAAGMSSGHGARAALNLGWQQAGRSRGQPCAVCSLLLTPPCMPYRSSPLAMPHPPCSLVPCQAVDPSDPLVQQLVQDKSFLTAVQTSQLHAAATAAVRLLRVSRGAAGPRPHDGRTGWGGLRGLHNRQGVESLGSTQHLSNSPLACACTGALCGHQRRVQAAARPAAGCVRRAARAAGGPRGAGPRRRPGGAAPGAALPTAGTAGVLKPACRAGRAATPRLPTLAAAAPPSCGALLAGEPRCPAPPPRRPVGGAPAPGGAAQHAAGGAGPGGCDPLEQRAPHLEDQGGRWGRAGACVRGGRTSCMWRGMACRGAGCGNRNAQPAAAPPACRRGAHAAHARCPLQRTTWRRQVKQTEVIAEFANRLKVGPRAKPAVVLPAVRRPPLPCAEGQAAARLRAAGASLAPSPIPTPAPHPPPRCTLPHPLAHGRSSRRRC